MAEGYTSTLDPTTGTRQETRFQYEPIQPPDTSGMGGINPEFVKWALENQKIADAEKALDAAIQFQGLRGYQQALKSGDPAEKAMARYGPMMFRKTFGSAMRSVTPPTPRPMNALDEARMRELDRRGLPQDLTLQKPLVTELPEIPGAKVVQVPGSRAYRVIPGPQPQTMTESVRQVPNKDFVPGVAGSSPVMSLTNRTTRGLSPATPAPVQTASPDNFVVMTNTKGQQVRVPQADVERAKKLGYK